MNKRWKTWKQPTKSYLTIHKKILNKEKSTKTNEATTEELQKIRVSFNKHVTSAEEKVSNLEKTVHGKLIIKQPPEPVNETNANGIRT